MSKWTSVLAVIEILQVKKPELGLTYIEAIGPNEEFADIDLIYESWRNSENYIPCGSEGSLKFEIKAVEDCKYLVTIYGNLRDYSNYTEIVQYLNRIKNNNTIVKGVVEIKTYDALYILNYNDIYKKWNSVFTKYLK